MRLRKMFKNKLAFTLVELVIAIAVMAILAGAVAGTVVGVRTTAQKSAATTPRDDLKASLHMFLNTEYKKNTSDKSKDWAALKSYIQTDFPKAEVSDSDVSTSPTSASGKTIKISYKAQTTKNLNTIESLEICVCADKYYAKFKYNFKDDKVVSSDDEEKATAVSA